VTVEERVMSKEKNVSCYQLKITLRGSEPPIWRRVVVPGSITLSKLHDVIQVVMGWTDTHLHEFVVRGVRYGVPDPESPSEWRNEARVTLNRLLDKKRQKFFYVYDFGDGWEHVIELEEIISDEEALSQPICIGGERACPPEDCGGIYGYYDLLRTIKDPGHPKHDDMVGWLGDEIDPEFFDMDEVNEILSRLKWKAN
jgi:hypothetical protein